LRELNRDWKVRVLMLGLILLEPKGQRIEPVSRQILTLEEPTEQLTEQVCRRLMMKREHPIR
jgi:hypothetical protein